MNSDFVAEQVPTDRKGSSVQTLLFLGFLLLTSCAAASAPERSSLEETARAYFEIYADRADFDRFMDFYADGATLNDIVYGSEIQGKDEIRDFFDWQRGSFSTVEAGPILEVSEQVVSNDVVITRGLFKRFSYNDEVLGPWEFVIWQQFNQAGKVIRQEDWINYAPKKILIGGDED